MEVKLTIPATGALLKKKDEFRSQGWFLLYMHDGPRW